MRASTVLALLLVASLRPLAGQDTVTIPRARFEELERKEAELEKLKGDLKVTKGENQQLKKQHQEDTVKISAAAAAPAVKHESPPLASLPAMGETDKVEAVDLGNYYRSDPAGADQRFRKRRFTVVGDIVAFERKPFVSGYGIVLKTAEREMRVVCDMIQGEEYRAMFTVKNGLEMVGQTPTGTRVHIAKVGDTVEVHGQCRGAGDSEVKMAACELKAVR